MTVAETLQKAIYKVSEILGDRDADVQVRIDAAFAVEKLVALRSTLTVEKLGVELTDG